MIRMGIHSDPAGGTMVSAEAELAGRAVTGTAVITTGFPFSEDGRTDSLLAEDIVKVAFQDLCRKLAMNGVSAEFIAELTAHIAKTRENSVDVKLNR